MQFPLKGVAVEGWMRASRMSENKSGMERPRVPAEQGAQERINYRVRVMGVDTIRRNVVQHSALRRLGKQRRKPVFGLLVTNRFTIRVHVPTQEVCAECHTELHQQRMSRMPTHAHRQARGKRGRLRALSGCACTGCARWEKEARL
jgi:hypothetical protein